MSSTERQKRLLEEFEQARTSIREFITSRSERERTALSTGATDQWTAGELLTAIRFWMDYMVRAHGIFPTRRDAASSRGLWCRAGGRIGRASRLGLGAARLGL